MSFPVTAKIAVENTTYSFDKLFDYLIPTELSDEVSPGCRVLVNFGRGAKMRQGFVFQLSDSVPENIKKMKSIVRVIDKTPLLDSEMISLAEWVASRTFCTLYDAAKAMLPSGMCINITETYAFSSEYAYDISSSLDDDERKVAEFLKTKQKNMSADKIYKALELDPDSRIIEKLCNKGCLTKNTDTARRINDATVRIASLAEEYEESISFKLTTKQTAVVEFLRNVGSASTKEISYFTGVTMAVTENLHRRGVIVYSEADVFRTPEKMRMTKPNNDEIVLTTQQEKAYNELKKLRDDNKANAALLHGVTGSGKTKIYMKLIDDVVNNGKGVIVLVPEISLTPQMLSMFYARYSDKVAVMHSALSMGERTDEWKRIKNGSANIVVGTRSAVFAPIKNLSMIIVDEEQESTYKSEMTPRYNARDVAKFRCADNKALLILGSATPSVESYANALDGRYKLVELTERYSKAGLPDVITVDISNKENMGNMRTISKVLANEIEINLADGMQTILLINRRGFNTFVACTKCKSVMMCPNCSISLTYHSANDRLMCHYCGYSEPVRTSCPSCGEETVRFSGFGTQRVEQELQILFPNAKILRMDADTTGAKNSHDIKFSEFADGKYDIMVGTQMVAKGLDFPNVTLVGVISVDQQLYNDDFKSTERTFDLLTQVVGRSGRGNNKGRAVIQTLAPENAVIELAAAQDYKAFYDTEISIRRGMTYPPYCDICIIGFGSTGDGIVKSASKAFFELLKIKLSSEEYKSEKVIILGPVSPKISKISNNYREQLIIKCRNSGAFRKLISECLKDFSTNKKYNKVMVYADINPDSIL